MFVKKCVENTLIMNLIWELGIGHGEELGTGSQSLALTGSQSLAGKPWEEALPPEKHLFLDKHFL